MMQDAQQQPYAPQPQLERLLTLSQAAAQLGQSVAMIANAIPVFLVEDVVLCKQSDVLAWKNEVADIKANYKSMQLSGGVR